MPTSITLRGAKKARHAVRGSREPPRELELGFAEAVLRERLNLRVTPEEHQRNVSIEPMRNLHITSR